MTDQPEGSGVEQEAIVSDVPAADATPTADVKDEGVKPSTKTYTEDDYNKLENELARERRRIGKITAQKYQYKAEVDQYSKRLADFEAKQTPPEAPKASQFQTYDEYLKAVTRHEIKQSQTETAKPQQQAQAESQKQLWRTQREPALKASVDAARASFPDYEQKLQANAAVLGSLSQDVADAFLDADNGGAAIYQLIEDGMLPLLNGMTPDTVQALIERAEDKAMSNKKPNISKAPPPMASAKGTSPGSKSLDSMSSDQLRAWMKS